MPGEYLQYGGQAIIEGVMMRSPDYFAVACRAPNGEIVSTVEALEKTWIGRQKWLKLPFLRGSMAILDSMALGTKAMRFASNIQMDPAYQPEQTEADEKSEPAKATTPSAVPSKAVQDTTVGLAMFGGLAIGLVLFAFVPNLIGENVKHIFNIQDYRLTNFVVETIKVIFFLAYVYGIGQLPEIGRVYMYHGAEHKAINTLEANEALTLDNCRAQTRLHPRCGTSFAIVVLIVSMMVFTFISRYPFPILKTHILLAAAFRFCIELPILPVIAGISYEMIRIAGKFRNTALIKTLFWPGLMTQYLTTKEPDPTQIEVALKSLQLVVDAQNHKNAAATGPAA